MCGIYGSTINYNNDQVSDKLKRTQFRGPDQSNFKFYNNNDSVVILGHNRLSIIDLDERSNQPMNYKNIEIVFNGEIYNFQLLKSRLITLGYSFKTESDTEVLCALYLEYGESCVDHLNGMFAFVIFDRLNNTLFGARDRLGQKPFYYYHNGQDFEFSSQISSIQLHNKSLSISNKAIELYLGWGTIPDPYSIFNEIKKLKAGHTFKFDLKKGILQIKKYWDIDNSGTSKFQGSFQDAKSKLSTLINDAVNIRMFADVPVGVFLSGGIDSSLIAATAVKTQNKKVKSFSVKFNDKGFDESVYAEKVAKILKTDHTTIECNYNEGLELIDNFTKYYDEPFSDSSAIPSMLLAKHTRKHVTVALSGDAGDESFLGYQRYDWIKKGDSFMKLPFFIRNLLSKIVALHPNYRYKILSKFMTEKSINQAYLNSITSSNYNDFSDIEELSYLLNKNKNLLERVSDFDLKTYLNWDINTKVDRATMAFSLEARSPLMDHRIIEFSRSLPTEFKYFKNNKKRILKDILYSDLPKSIFDRPKAGFTMPFKVWFRNELKDYVKSELNKDSLKNIPHIDASVVSKQIDEHLNNKWNHEGIIWKLLVLTQWLKSNKGYEVR